MTNKQIEVLKSIRDKAVKWVLENKTCIGFHIYPEDAIVKAGSYNPGAIDHLAEKGYVEVDRRAVDATTVSITGKGLKALESAVEINIDLDEEEEDNDATPEGDWMDFQQENATTALLAAEEEKKQLA